MPVTETAPGQTARKLEADGSSGDINCRGGEHWHLDDPHKKALAALAYTSVFKGVWCIVARSGESLFSFLRPSHRRTLSKHTAA